MIYKWRDGSCWRTARCFDAATGEEGPFVFQYDTYTHQVGRFVPSSSGQGIAVDRVSKRPVEVWETRPLRIEWKDGEVEESADMAHVMGEPLPLH